MSKIDDYTIADARSYGFGLLELYKLWHWNLCFPHTSTHDKISELARAAQHELDERYQLLPLDANGEVIHIGDELVFDDHEFIVSGIGLLEGNGVGVVYYTTDGGLCDGHLASDCRHYHKQTVEDILREFVITLDQNAQLSNGVARTIAEYAPMLKVREAQE